MKKSLILLILGFSLGVLFHALLFPDFLSNGIVFIPEAPKPSQSPQNDQQDFQSTYYVYFDGTSFNRHNITVPFSRYLVIRNMSETQTMTLGSAEKTLATVRPYGYTEQIRVRMDKKGQFVVFDKTNPKERVVITVK